MVFRERIREGHVMSSDKAHHGIDAVARYYGNTDDGLFPRLARNEPVPPGDGLLD